MALPDYGLMTKADKQKLDGIDTSILLKKADASSTYLTQANASETYLTITAASGTYATKAEMREYIRQVIESDTGFVFMNGNNSEVGVIPVLGDKKDPQLSVNPTSISLKDTAKSSPTISVSRLGNGAITATHNNSSIIDNLVVNGTTVTVNYVDNGAPEPGTATITISVAATDEYKAASVEVPYEVTSEATEGPEEAVVD